MPKCLAILGTRLTRKQSRLASAFKRCTQQCTRTCNSSPPFPTLPPAVCLFCLLGLCAWVQDEKMRSSGVLVNCPTCDSDSLVKIQQALKCPFHVQFVSCVRPLAYPHISQATLCVRVCVRVCVCMRVCVCVGVCVFDLMLLQAMLSA